MNQRRDDIFTVFSGRFAVDQADEDILTVVITGGGGRTAYALLPLVCSGQAFGVDQPLKIRLLDIPASASKMKGLEMEIRDCCFPLVDDITSTTDIQEAFSGVKFAILIGGFSPVKASQKKSELLARNVPIFKSMGEALEKYADPYVKVAVVASPANTLTWVAMKYAPSVPRTNFTAISRLDHERLRSILVSKINDKIQIGPKPVELYTGEIGRIAPKDIRRVIVWGNQFDTQVPDVSFAEVNLNSESDAEDQGRADWVSVHEVLENATVIHLLLQAVKTRSTQLLQLTGYSTALSSASAVCLHIRDWLFGTARGDFTSMSVDSRGNPYEVPEGLVFSFPVTCEDGEFTIVPNLAVDEMKKKEIADCVKELLLEQEVATKRLQDLGRDFKSRL